MNTQGMYKNILKHSIENAMKKRKKVKIKSFRHWTWCSNWNVCRLLNLMANQSWSAGDTDGFSRDSTSTHFCFLVTFVRLEKNNRLYCVGGPEPHRGWRQACMHTDLCSSAVCWLLFLLWQAHQGPVPICMYLPCASNRFPQRLECTSNLVSE